jgi:hypothetical protein
LQSAKAQTILRDIRGEHTQQSTIVAKPAVSIRITSADQIRANVVSIWGVSKLPNRTNTSQLPIPMASITGRIYEHPALIPNGKKSSPKAYAVNRA